MNNLSDYIKFNKSSLEEIERVDLVIYQINKIYRIWKDQLGIAPNKDWNAPALGRLIAENPGYVRVVWLHQPH